MNLTKVQQRALDKMVLGKVYCAYELHESMATLDALVRKGYLKKRSGLGAMFSPRTEIEYMKVNKKE